jgi:hypothetical protein
MKKILLPVVGACVVLASCKKQEGCTDPVALNYNADAEKDDGSCTYGPDYTVPATYAFTDDAGNNTVDYNGQAQRLEMLSEMVTYMKTANTSGTALSAVQLKAMYANNAYTWTDAGALGMTGSTKQLRDKTANNDAVIIAVFESFMDSIANNSALTTTGVDDGGPGVTGVVVSGTKKYLCNQYGMEFGQVIEKGLMGAVFMHQICTGYLGDAKMNVDNTTAVNAGAGQYYTTMEHHWDEAYGYFTTAVNYPTTGTDRFWGKYASSREALLQSASKIATAFRTGRAAISNNDLETRDAQRVIIRAEMEKLAAATAISYINYALANVTDDALRNHALSECWGFIYSLQFAHNPQFNSAEVSALLALLGTDFYNVSVTDLNSVKNQLSTAFGLDSVKDQL